MIARKRGSWYSNTLDESLELALISIRQECSFTKLGETMMQEMEVLLKPLALNNSSGK